MEQSKEQIAKLNQTLRSHDPENANKTILQDNSYLDKS